MRIVSILASATVLMMISLPQAQAATHDLALIDVPTLQGMEQRAMAADPRERCFLYTELARGYAELAGHQIAAGELDEASATLKQVERYADLVHTGLTTQPNKHRKLKDAEMLMHETSYKVGEFLRLVGSDDRAVILAALKQVNKANEDLLAQVFAH